MIEVQAPDGTVVEFPDDTPKEVMAKAMQARFGAPQPQVVAAAPVVPESMRSVDRANKASGLFGELTDKVMSGLMLGFRDEAAAGVHAGLGSIGDLLRFQSPDIGKRYDEALAYERAREKQTAENYPVFSTAAELLGGLAALPSAVPGRLAQAAVAAPTLAQTAGKSAAVAGGLGALTGFGQGEGGLGKRAENAAVTGALSAAAGAATPYLIRGVGKGVEMGKNFFGQGDQMARGERLLARALERDKINAPAIRAKVAEMEASGIEPMVTDIGGENVKRLARASATVPGEGTAKIQQAVDARNAAQAGNILYDIKTYLSPVDDFHGLMDAVTRARSQAAAPAYEKAFQVHKFVNNDRIDDFLKDPIVKRGVGKGLEIQRLEALAEGKKFNPMDYGVTGFNEAGDYVTGAKPNLRLLDAAKRGMDEIIDEARDPVTGKINWNQRLRAIDQVRRSFVDELDKVTAAQNNGESLYKEARRLWAGPSAARDALTFGRRDVLRKDPEVIAKRIADMSDTEKDFVKAGAARALSDIVNGKADDLDITKSMLRNPEVRKRLAAAFEKDMNFDKFVANIERRREMMRTDQFISPRTGSQTAMRAADVPELLQDPGIVPMDAVGQALRGNLAGAATTAIKGQIPRLTQGITSRTGASIADLVTQRGTPGIEDILRRIEQRKAADMAQRGIASQRISGLLAPAEGTSIGLLSD